MGTVVQAGEEWRRCSTFQADLDYNSHCCPSLVADLDWGAVHAKLDHENHHYPKDQRSFLCCQWMMGMGIQIEERLEAKSVAFQMDWTSAPISCPREQRTWQWMMRMVVHPRERIGAFTAAF